MIVYGIKASHQLTDDTNETCPSCGQKTIHISVFQKYTHIFWIPVFPINKVTQSYCSNCKQTLDEKEMPSAFKLSNETARAKSTLPIWTFSGSVILAGLIVWGVIVGQQNSDENKACIEKPQKGDVYEYKTNEGQYTLMKVEEVKDDSVFIVHHQFETDKMKGLSDLKNKGDEGYSPDLYVIMKSELATMLDKGEILDVERK